VRVKERVKVKEGVKVKERVKVKVKVKERVKEREREKEREKETARSMLVLRLSAKNQASTTAAMEPAFPSGTASRCSSSRTTELARHGKRRPQSMRKEPTSTPARFSFSPRARFSRTSSGISTSAGS
jgi:hypothetical protein